MKKDGIKSYYQAKIEECELILNEKTQDLRRLEAQRNALNAKGIVNLGIPFILTIIIISTSFKRGTSVIAGARFICR